MKRTTKSVTAFVLTLMLIMSFPAAAFATGSTGTIDGSSTVENVTLEVLVPSTLGFALDPLGLDVTGANQISTQDYYFVNQTFAPVKVSVSITAQTSGGATLVSTASGLSLDDTKVTDKKLYFGALGATDITGGSINTTTTGGSFNVGTGPAAYYSSATTASATLIPFTPNSNGTTGAAVIAFALGAATEGSTPGSISALASNNDGIAAFQFFSQLNTYAKWEANDITVSGAYTLTPLRDTTYTGYSYVGSSLNQLVPEAPSTPTYSSAGFISGSAIVTTIAAISNTSSSALGVRVPFYANGLTATSLTLNGSAFTFPTTQYTLANNELYIKADDPTYCLRVATAGSKTIALTLSDSSTYTFTIVQH